MYQFLLSSKKWVLITALTIITAGCSDQGGNTSVEDYSPAQVDTKHASKSILDEASELLKTVKQLQSQPDPLTDKEQEALDELIAKVDQLQSDPDTVREVESIKSTLVGLKAIDEPAITLDIQLLSTQH